MRPTGFPDPICQFCGLTLALPADYQKTYTCVCGTSYFVLGHDDLYMAESGVAKVLGLPREQVEVRIQRGIDVLLDYEGQDPRTGELQALVFGRQKGGE